MKSRFSKYNRRGAYAWPGFSFSWWGFRKELIGRSKWAYCKNKRCSDHWWDTRMKTLYGPFDSF